MKNSDHSSGGGAKPRARDPILRHVGTAFIIAIVTYVGFYSCDERLRERKGPWQVTFTQTNGAPMLVVNEAALGVTNVSFIVTNAPHSEPRNKTLRFDVPGQGIPFGRVLFEDLTYLPGTVVFDFFGHEIELLPRVLVLDRREVGWERGLTFRMGVGTLPPQPKVRKKI